MVAIMVAIVIAVHAAVGAFAFKICAPPLGLSAMLAVLPLGVMKSCFRFADTFFTPIVAVMRYGWQRASHHQ